MTWYEWVYGVLAMLTCFVFIPAGVVGCLVCLGGGGSER